MGAASLVLLYLATAVLLAAAVHGLRLAGRGRGRRAISPGALVVLTLLPLAFTAEGFLPGRTLAPTPELAGVAPWADPELVARVEAASDRPNPLLLDPLVQMIPWRRAARDGWLINPAEGGGSALLGNGQSAVLFPTEAAARLLPPFRAATYSQAARLLLAVWGMFLLARASGRRGLATSEPAALVAAAVYCGSGFLQLWRLHPHSLVAATAPWILLALLAMVRRPGPLPAVGLAAAGAVAVFGGHPETLLHVLLFGGLLAAAVALGGTLRASAAGAAPAATRAPGLAGGRPQPRRWTARRVGRQAGRLALWAAVGGLLAALLAAPVLLPLVENLTQSTEWRDGRAERRDQGAASFADAAERLAPAATLYALGDPRRGDWQGPENLAELGGGSVGAAALLLALIALSGRRRRLAAVLLGLGFLGLLAAARTPFVATPFGWVPLLADSLLKRLSLWWVLAAALAAALGVDRLRRHRGGGGRTAWIGLGGLAVAGVVAAAGLRSPEVGRALGWEIGGLAAALAGAGLIGLATGRSQRRGRAVRATAWVLLAAALVGPRAAQLAGWVPATSADGFYPETLATRFVAERLAEAGDVGYRVAGLDAALVPHSAAFFGFEEVRVYDPVAFAPLVRFQAALGEPDRNGWVRILDPARPALAFLGARYLFDHPSMTHRPGVDVVYLGRDAIVYENPRALPRLFVPASIEVLGDGAAALEAAREIEDYARRAVVTGAVLDLSVEPGAAVRRDNGAATVERLAVTRGRVRAEVVAEEATLVASSQPAIPGWRVRVDGERVSPVRVNGAFLGVEVAAGRHLLDLSYRPDSWRLGLWLALFGGLATIGIWVRRGLRRRRRRS